MRPHMLRHTPWLLLVLAATACGSVEYRDTHAAVNANPLCVSEPDQPNQPVARDCVREQSATWRSERHDGKVDFSGKDNH